MQQAQYNKYMTTTVQTATPAQLLVMLYDGAIRFCKAGIEAMKENKYEEVNRNLCKAQDIVREFIVTLDRSSPIAERLLPLYEYFIARLMEANAKKEPTFVQEVIGYLAELKETWVNASRQVATGASHG